MSRPTDVTPGRLIPFDRGSATWNMAVDQAILESTSEQPSSDSSATLRFYGWSKPTLSLGYFQSHQEVEPRFKSLAMVRRSTGGGAIVHDQELTYSLSIPTGSDQRLSREDLYVEMHAAIIGTLTDFAVTAKPFRLSGSEFADDKAFLCFQRRTDEDLIVGGYKVVGSAQRRVRMALLQHGSILLKASQSVPELPGVFELTSIPISVDELCANLAEAVGRWLGIRWERQHLTENEQLRAAEFETRFKSSGWWLRR